jgi:hypothetical protein
MKATTVINIASSDLLMKASLTASADRTTAGSRSVMQSRATQRQIIGCSNELPFVAMQTLAQSDSPEIVMPS